MSCMCCYVADPIDGKVIQHLGQEQDVATLNDKVELRLAFFVI